MVCRVRNSHLPPRKSERVVRGRERLEWRREILLTRNWMVQSGDGGGGGGDIGGLRGGSPV